MSFVNHNCFIFRYLITPVLGCLFLIPVCSSAQRSDNKEVNNYLLQIEKYQYTKHLDSSTHYFNKAIKLAIEENDSVGIFYSYKYLGNAYEHISRYDSTLFYYSKAEQYIPKKNDQLKSFFLNDKAYTFRAIGDYEKSTKLYLQSLKLAEKQGKSKELGISQVNVAYDYSLYGLYEESNLYYEKALTLSKELKDTRLLLVVYNYYSESLVKQGKYKQAYSYLQKARDGFIATNDSISLAHVWRILSDYYYGIHKKDSAISMAKLAEKEWEKRREHRDLVMLCASLGSKYLEWGQLSEAEQYLLKAESYNTPEGAPMQSEIYKQLATLYDKKKNFLLANKYWQFYNKSTEEQYEKELNNNLLKLRLEYDTEKQQLLIERKENELERKTAERNYVLLVSALFLITIIIIIVLYIKIKTNNKSLDQLNEQLKRSLEKREALMHELHHRVKNNLTLLKSLLFLQTKATDNEEAKKILNECQYRIESMALVHQNLYEEKNNEYIDFTTFLTQLFQELEIAFNPQEKEIDFSITGNSSEISLSQSIVLGIIINELTTNSLKYAFDNVNKGRIHVEIEKKNDQLTIVYADSGKGLQQEWDIEKGGFGFKIIRILVQQINASINYQYTEGWSKFTIETNVA